MIRSCQGEMMEAVVSPWQDLIMKKVDDLVKQPFIVSYVLSQHGKNIVQFRNNAYRHKALI